MGGIARRGRALFRRRRRPTSSSSRPSAAPARAARPSSTPLAEVCDPGTKVVVIGHVNDVPLYRELIRRGVSEYLVAPVAHRRRHAAIVVRLFVDAGRRAARPHHRLRRRQGRRRLLDASPTTSPGRSRTLFSTRRRDRRSRPRLRHRRPRLQPGPAAGHRRGGLRARAARRRLARPPAVELHRPSVACSPRPRRSTAPTTSTGDAFERADRHRCAPRARASCSTCRMSGPPGRAALLVAADEIVIVAAPDLANLRNAKNLIDLLQQAAAQRHAAASGAQPGRHAEAAGDQRRANSPRRSRLEPLAIIPFDAAALRHGRQQRPDDRRDRRQGAESPRPSSQLAARRDRPRRRPKRSEARPRQPLRPAAAQVTRSQACDGDAVDA